VPSSRRDRGHLIYENPRLYDLAFSFRDIPGECDGLLALARTHGIAAPRRVLEIACGPGHHLREFARRGMHALGVDLSPDMLGYAKALSQEDGVRVKLQRADMRRFKVTQRVDLALCLFDSFTHCTSDADGVAALQATAASLVRGGLLIIELTHPADYFDADHGRTLSSWTQRHPDVVVKARYDCAHRDAVEETYVATMTIDAKYRDGRAPRRIVSRQLHRMWLRSAVANIAARSGAFDVVGWYGDLASRVPLSMKLASWRMIVVLRRRARA
jgi:SAM-dependent methyltransferase